MDNEIDQLLAGFPVTLIIPVQWGDQDAMRHVNNVVHFRWFESARVAYGHKVGLWDMLPERNIGPILASISCNYRRQLNFPDTVHVGARITRIGRSSTSMEHRIVSEAQRAVVADADSTIVVFDYSAQRPTPMPAEMRAAIESLEGRTFERL